MIIKDGVGRGYNAEVSEENHLQTDAVTSVIDLHTNQAHQTYWSLPFDSIDPVGADDYFFYIKNTGTKDLHVTDIRVESTVAGSVEVHEVSGTPSYTAGGRTCKQKR